jgi:hypothetical protein
MAKSNVAARESMRHMLTVPAETTAATRRLGYPASRLHGVSADLEGSSRSRRRPHLRRRGRRPSRGRRDLDRAVVVAGASSGLAMASAARPLPASTTTGRALPRLAATAPDASCPPFTSMVTEDRLGSSRRSCGGRSTAEGGQLSRAADTAVARRATGVGSSNATTCTMVTTAMSPGHERLPPGQDVQI